MVVQSKILLVLRAVPGGTLITLPVAITTVDRKGENYVHRTIASLGMTGYFDTDNPSLNLFVGKPEDEFVSHYRENGFANVNTATKEEIQKAGIMRLRAVNWCAFNHIRAIREMQKFDGWSDALFLQDDVVFADKWIIRIKQMIHLVRSHYGKNWIITLFRPHDDILMQDSVDAEKMWLEVPMNRSFMGIPAIIYPREIIGELPAFLESRCGYIEIMPMRGGLGVTVDNAIGEFAKERGISILATVPSLVQHIGEKSSVGTGHYYSSACFRRAL